MGRLHNWFDKYKKKPSETDEVSVSPLHPAAEETEDENFFDLIEKALADSKKTEEEMLAEIEPDQQDLIAMEPDAESILEDENISTASFSEMASSYTQKPETNESETTLPISENTGNAEETDLPAFSISEPEEFAYTSTPSFLSQTQNEKEENTLASETADSPLRNIESADENIVSRSSDDNIEYNTWENEEKTITASSEDDATLDQTIAFDTDSLDSTAVRDAVRSIEDLDFAEYAPKKAASATKNTEEKTFVDLDHIEAHRSNEQKTKISDHWWKNAAVAISAFVKQHKIASISTAVACGVVAFILIITLIIQATLDPLRGYTQLAAAKGNVIQTLIASGSVTPVERYEITSLVTGEIAECNYEVGDTVKAGDVLYKFDDTDAQLSVQLAQNEVDKAKSQKDATKAELDNLKIYAPTGGTIENLSISKGSAVRGGQICQIRIDEENVIPVVPSINGTVKSLSVKEGSTIKSGGLIATLDSSSLNAAQKGNEIDEQSSELSLKAAQKFLDNHSIKSPIDGVIVSKNAKVGDNITAINEKSPMMVISNTSSMKFKIEIDETEIWDMKVGQTAIVTADAIPGETFGGEVTKIANEGNVKGNGITTFDVEITIKDPGELKSGMNVHAKVIQNSATGVISLPVEALLEPDGKNALVIVKNQEQEEDEFFEEEMQDENDKTEASLFPWIEVPKGCSLVTVKYGITDGTNVEILSGLREGDIVCYLPKENNGEYNMEPVENTTTLQVDSPKATAEKNDNSSKADKSKGDSNTKNDNETKRTAEPTSTNGTTRSKSTASPSTDTKEDDDPLTPEEDEDLFSQSGGMVL